MVNHPHRRYSDPRQHASVRALEAAGVYILDAAALRRIAMTLHRWYELECGTDAGCIERDGENADGRPFMTYGRGPTFVGPTFVIGRYPIADREAGALKRLRAILARYPTLSYYVQGDPRGAPLYILRPGDVPAGATVHSCYSRGVAVYK